MKDPTYNGWTNYETWCMALWIDNDQGSYTWSRSLAQDALDEAVDSAEDDEPLAESKRTAEGTLADALKAWQEEEMPEMEASVWSDLLSAAFSEIDWYEIAQNYLEEVAE